jgi:hypothetical protein
LLPEDDYKVVALPYFRFYNQGEKFADTLDWSNPGDIRVMEKLDGSLIIMYWYGGEWRFATSGQPDAYNNIKLINTVWKKLNYKFPDDSDKDKTFMFELCSLQNKIVVSYEMERLVLHGVRSINTFQEFLPDSYAQKYGYELIKSFTFGSFDEAHQAVSQLDPKQNEGYVYLQANDSGRFKRVKDKHPEYVILSKMAESDKIEMVLIKTIQSRDESEFLATNPDKLEEYNEYKAKYTKLCNLILDEWTTLMSNEPVPDRKTFFQTINSFDTDIKRWYKHCLLEMYTKHTKGLVVDQEAIFRWLDKQTQFKIHSFLF